TRSTTSSSTLSLHDALPIFELSGCRVLCPHNLRTRQPQGDNMIRKASVILLVTIFIAACASSTDPNDPNAKAKRGAGAGAAAGADRKSTRLNSSHVSISYAV